MRVFHHLELPGALERSGIGTATRHQRKALAGSSVRVTESPSREPFGLLDLPAVADADVVHCNVVGPGTLAVAACAQRTGTPLVLHAHVTAEDFAGSFRGSRRFAGVLGRYLRRVYSLADLVLCPSAYTRRVLESYPVNAPVLPVSNGVDAERLAGHDALRSTYRERFGLSGFVVFAVGNVFERKGLSTFCRLAERTPYEYLWAGPYDRGPLASPGVRAWTRDPPENVTFPGWVDDVRGVFGAGDVFLFPTHVENQGIAVLEAMACGKPVVLRRLPVFEAHYTHGEDCLMCETFSEFETALSRLEREPALRERLGENARETASEHSLSALATALERAYRQARECAQARS